MKQEPMNSTPNDVTSATKLEKWFVKAVQSLSADRHN